MQTPHVIQVRFREEPIPHTACHYEQLRSDDSPNFHVLADMKVELRPAYSSKTQGFTHTRIPEADTNAEVLVIVTVMAEI